METTTQEKFSKNGKATEKKFVDEIDSAMDFYNNQLKLVLNYYSDILEKSFPKTSPANKNEKLVGTPYMNPWANWIWKPFTSLNRTITESFAYSYERTFRQMMTFNRDLMTAFSNEMQSSQADREEITKKYKQTLETRYEISKRITDALLETYNKQLAFVMESDRALMEEINKQFNIIVRQNQELWLTLFAMFRLAFTEPKKNEKTDTKSTQDQTREISVI